MSFNEKKIEKYSFNLNAKLGFGSFSEVFLGKDDLTNLPVAIKVINYRKISENKYLLDLLNNEVSILKNINHPNILKLFDVLNTANNIYIVTEYCNEGDLGNKLKKYKRFAEIEAINMMKDIIKGAKKNLQKIIKLIKNNNLIIITKKKLKIRSSRIK